MMKAIVEWYMGTWLFIRFSNARFFAWIECAETHACMGSAIPDWQYSLMYWRWFFRLLFRRRHSYARD